MNQSDWNKLYEKLSINEPTDINEEFKELFVMRNESKKNLSRSIEDIGVLIRNLSDVEDKTSRKMAEKAESEMVGVLNILDSIEKSMRDHQYEMVNAFDYRHMAGKNMRNRQASSDEVIVTTYTTFYEAVVDEEYGETDLQVVDTDEDKELFDINDYDTPEEMYEEIAQHIENQGASEFDGQSGWYAADFYIDPSTGDQEETYVAVKGLDKGEMKIIDKMIR